MLKFPLAVYWQRFSTADVPHTLGSRNIPVSQLQASNSKGSQWLNCSSSLTDCLPSHLTPLYSLTQLNFSVESYSLGADRGENTAYNPCCCCVTSSRRLRIALLRLYGSLSRKVSILHSTFQEIDLCDVRLQKGYSSASDSSPLLTVPLQNWLTNYALTLPLAFNASAWTT
jgi:hypothetical protein